MTQVPVSPLIKIRVPVGMDSRKTLGEKAGERPGGVETTKVAVPRRGIGLKGIPFRDGDKLEGPVREERALNGMRPVGPNIRHENPRSIPDSATFTVNFHTTPQNPEGTRKVSSISALCSLKARASGGFGKTFRRYVPEPVGFLCIKSSSNPEFRLVVLKADPPIGNTEYMTLINSK